MDLPAVRTVRVAGVEYELRAWKEREWVRVRAFRDGEPVGPLYGVNASERHDLEVVRGLDAVNELMDVAESHLAEFG